MILYFAEELEDDEEFLRWKLNNDSKHKSEMHQIVAVEQLQEKAIIVDPKECIVIASTDKSVKYARDRDMAVLGYQSPDSYMGDFLKVSYVICGFEEIDMEYIDRVYRRHHGLPWTIFETERCVARELCMEDLDALFCLYDKPGMTDFVEPLFPYEEEKAYEEAYIKNMYGYFEYGMWLVFSKETGELIGRAGLEHRDYTDCAAGDGEAGTASGTGVPLGVSTELEMGYMIAPEYQKKGYATEVCKAIIEYAKENTSFHQINCLIDEENVASIALVDKLGFEFAGISDAAGHSMRRYILKYNHEI